MKAPLHAATSFHLLSDGTPGDDLMIGTGDNDTLYGLAGNDTLRGWGGDDSLNGGAGDDVMNGGAGNDQLKGDDGNDTLLGGDGDQLQGQYGDDVLRMSGQGWLSGGPGDDLMDASASTGNCSFDDASGDDTLIGGSGNDSVGLGGGSDQVSTGAGDDSVSLSDWRPQYSSDAETIDGGTGIDTLHVPFSDDAPTVVWRNDPTQTQQVGNHSVTGIEALDLSFDAGNNLVTNLLTATNDTLLGGAGNDTFKSGDGDDILNGGMGSDLLSGGAGGDILSGDSRLGGAGSDDVLDGGTGADVLRGGDGSDAIYCGDDTRRDAVQLDSLLGFDSVYEFNSGRDKLKFDPSRLPVGDGDKVVDGAITIASPGGYGALSELVVAAAPVAGALTAEAAAAAVGSADSAYAVGDTVLFAVHNGDQAAVYYFESAGNDADVSAAELSLVVLLADTNQIATGDFVFSA